MRFQNSVIKNCDMDTYINHWSLNFRKEELLRQSLCYISINRLLSLFKYHIPALPHSKFISGTHSTCLWCKRTLMFSLWIIVANYKTHLIWNFQDIISWEGGCRTSNVRIWYTLYVYDCTAHAQLYKGSLHISCHITTWRTSNRNLLSEFMNKSLLS